jgi:hypothetical protein
VAVKYGSQWGEWCSNEVSGSYRVGQWKFIRRGWDEFSSFLDSRWVITQRLAFGMMCGVGNNPLRQSFWSSIALLALWMFPWKIIFSSQMVPLVEG